MKRLSYRSQPALVDGQQPALVDDQHNFMTEERNHPYYATITRECANDKLMKFEQEGKATYYEHNGSYLRYEPCDILWCGMCV